MLEGQGISRSALIKTLGGVAAINGEDTQLLVLIGTPTRGIRESGVYPQNLVAWLLEPAIANGLRLALEQFSPHERIQEIGRECERIVLEWSDIAKVNWCRVREARPEVTVRRDEGSPLGSFRGKSVAVWGCGAIGGHVAEALARAGAEKLVLRDKSVVTPGVLVRQPFEDSDIGKNKAVATRERLRRIIPGLSVDVMERDILDGPIDQTDRADGVDMVIDADCIVASCPTPRGTPTLGCSRQDRGRFHGTGSSCSTIFVVCSQRKLHGRSCRSGAKDQD